MVPYAELAIQNGFTDLATIFRDALLTENGPALEQIINWGTTVPHKSQSKADDLTTMLDVASADTRKLLKQVYAFVTSSQENRRLVEGLCNLMAAEHLPPIEELARQTIKQVLIEQPKVSKILTKKKT